MIRPISVFGGIYASFPNEHWQLISNFTWIMASVLMNVMVTLLMLVRLIRARNEFAKALPNGNSGYTYGGVIAILVESAAPLTVFALGYAIMTILWYKLDSSSFPRGIGILDAIISLLYYSFCVSNAPM